MFHWQVRDIPTDTQKIAKRKKIASLCEEAIIFCRGDRIRTCDRLVPNQMRYRAALHPANSFVLSGCKITRFSLSCKRNKFIIFSN